MTRALLRLFWLPALVMVMGCQSHPTDRSAHLVNTADAHRLGYRQQWATDLAVPGNQKLAFVEVLDDLLVVVELPSNMVTAISLRDGSVLWETLVPTGAEHLHRPTRMGGIILLNSETHIYHLAADTGQMIELAVLESPVNHAPAIVEHFAVFGGVNGRVFAHDIRAGYAKWRYDLTGRVIASPLISRNDVFVTDSNGVYALLASDTGKVVWRNQTYGRISAESSTNGFSIFIACEDQSLYCLNRTTGYQRWVYPANQPLRQTPIALGNAVYLTEPGRGVTALNANTGAILWQLSADMRPIAQFADRLLLHGRSSLLLVDALNGRSLVETPTQTLQTVLPGPERSLILVSPAGRLLRLDPRS